MKKSSFTLTELLVIIAILAIGATMLLPALTIAEETARDASCTGKLKQIGIANLAYAADNKNHVACGKTCGDKHPGCVVFQDYDLNDNGNCWPGYLLSVGGYMGEALPEADYRNAAKFQEFKNRYFVCPNDSVWSAKGAYKGSYIIFFINRTALTANYGRHRNETLGGASKSARCIVGLDNPNATIFCDVFTYCKNQYFKDQTHPGSANALKLGGQVETIETKQASAANLGLGQTLCRYFDDIDE